MTEIATFGEFKIFLLSKKIVKKYHREICTSLDQIKFTEPHTYVMLLAESKEDRFFYNKWDHSIIALSGEDYAGILVAYERKSEGNEQYPHNSLYIGDFAVSQKCQRKGLGKFMIKTWLDYNKETGFLKLSGDLKFSLQTHSAKWNKHVQELYESFGFKKTATKTYENKIDNIYFLG